MKTTATAALAAAAFATGCAPDLNQSLPPQVRFSDLAYSGQLVRGIIASEMCLAQFNDARLPGVPHYGSRMDRSDLGRNTIGLTITWGPNGVCGGQQFSWSPPRPETIDSAVMFGKALTQVNEAVRPNVLAAQQTGDGARLARQFNDLTYRVDAVMQHVPVLPLTEQLNIPAWSPANPGVIGPPRQRGMVTVPHAP